jgi:dihydrodipicolinate synthase/N-acetylneuraminate lyase
MMGSKKASYPMNKELAGVVVPVITPVDDGDRVDEAAFRKVLRRLIESGVHVLFVGGSAGEGPLFPLSEWLRLMKIAHDEVGGALPLLGGVMETSSSRIAEKITLLKQIGFQHYVVTPSFYFPLKTADEHLRLFADCKEHDGGMNMIPYNLPGIVKAEIPIEVLVDAARRGWVKYCKESSANLDYFSRLVTQGREVGLQVFMGDELSMREGLKMGAVGIVPSSANFEAQPFVTAYNAALAGDEDALNSSYVRILQLRENLPFASDYFVAGVKYALACVGIGSGKPVSPMSPLTAEQQEKVKQFVHQSVAVH